MGPGGGGAPSRGGKFCKNEVEMVQFGALNVRVMKSMILLPKSWTILPAWLYQELHEETNVNHANKTFCHM